MIARGGGWVALASDPETVIGGAISSAVGSENEPGSDPKLVDICGSLDLGQFHFFLYLTVGRLLGPRYFTLPLMNALLNVVIICAFSASLGAHGAATVEIESENDDQAEG